MKMRNTLFCLCLLLCSPAWGADVPVPVATDSRIKTFVYSENDVFNLVTHYGYESNIEFGLGEQVDTISVGDRTPWLIVPSGRRLFVRALTTNAHTNMTVITNKHAYQFDITAVPAPVMPNEELAYVVRFFYPGERKNTVPPVYTDDPNNAGYANPMVSAPPAVASPPPVAPSPAPSPASPTSNNNVTPGGFNYSYTYTGSDAIAPVKLYDDGSSTYFKFRDISVSPIISVVGQNGQETAVSARRSGDYWVVDNIASRFTVRQGRETVCVYNEKFSRS
jgi:type IV secretion system protein VirB9